MKQNTDIDIDAIKFRVRPGYVFRWEVLDAPARIIGGLGDVPPPLSVGAHSGLSNYEESRMVCWYDQQWALLEAATGGYSEQWTPMGSSVSNEPVSPRPTGAHYAIVIRCEALYHEDARGYFGTRYYADIYSADFTPSENRSQSPPSSDEIIGYADSDAVWEELLQRYGSEAE